MTDSETQEAATRPSRRVLLAAAASVALVAVGTTFVVTRGPDRTTPLSAPASAATEAPGQPPLPPLQTDAENRATARHDAETTMAAMPVHPGARGSDQHGVPELNDRWLSQVQPAHHTVMRSAWWVVRGATPSAVARWYAEHAPPGFRSDGTVGGQGDGKRWVDEVYDVQPGHDRLPPTGTTLELQTTRIADGVGVRATVGAVWAPARPLASYVQDVSSIDVHTRHVGFGPPESTTTRSFTITDPDRVLAAAVAFDALQGSGPFGPIPCPSMLGWSTERIVFHTSTGDVTAATDGTCVATFAVSRGGRRTAPALADPDRLLDALGLGH